MYEFRRTIESLWSTVRGTSHNRTNCAPAAHASPQHVDFMREHPEYVAQNNAMAFLSENGGIEYNFCHCVSFLLPLEPRSGF